MALLNFSLKILLSHALVPFYTQKNIHFFAMFMYLKLSSNVLIN